MWEIEVSDEQNKKWLLDEVKNDYEVLLYRQDTVQWAREALGSSIRDAATNGVEPEKISEVTGLTVDTIERIARGEQ